MSNNYAGQKMHDVAHNVSMTERKLIHLFYTNADSIEADAQISNMLSFL